MSNTAKSFREWRDKEKQIVPSTTSLVIVPGQKKAHKSFATMTAKRRREVSSMGGKAVHAAGKAHNWNSETAAIAGRKGGLRHSKEHMSEIAKLGVAARRAKAKLRKDN